MKANYLPLTGALLLSWAASAVGDARPEAAAEAPQYDVAAYVWPAYQPEPRWRDLGVFDAGKGEWQNVWEAVPKWDGHDQPLRPLWGYENEADPRVMERKIDAAVSHGVNVFIYDWYWYGGRPFLEDALDKGFLGAANNGKMKFFVMWANHNVVNLWDNRVADKCWDRPIWPGGVSEEEFAKLAHRWIERYFRRPNYYRIGGRPVLMIYELRTFVDGIGGLAPAARALAGLRDACAEAGLGGVHLMACDHGIDAEMVKALGVDSATIYNFVHWASPAGDPDYADWARRGARRFDEAKSLGLGAYFAHCSVGWDTNPRYPKSSVQPTVRNSTPGKFAEALRRARDWCDRNTPPGYPRLITVNSWNEWTEGSYLEPDERHGFGYLEAVRDVFPPRPDSAVRAGGVSVDDLHIRDPFVVTDAEKGEYVVVSSIFADSVCATKGARTDGFGFTGLGVMTFRSKDLRTLTEPRQVLRIPEELGCVAVWAPELHRYRDRWYVFATLTLAKGGETLKPMPTPGHRLGRLEKRGTWIFAADTPEGPFTPVASDSVTPPEWMCLDGTFAVDAATQRPYIVFCHEWCQVGDGRMMLAELKPDLSGLAGRPVELFRASAAGSDGSVTDGPFLYRSPKSGKLFMTWSNFDRGRYAVYLRVAANGSVTGPWTDGGTLFAADGGHGMIFRRLDGSLAFTLHQPNEVTRERMKVFTLEDTGDTLKIRCGE